MDGYSGYHQIEILPIDQLKITFVISFGIFSYKRMPFDLWNALATFQRCMEPLFTKFMNEFLEVFMDDVIVYDKSFDCYLNNLDVFG